MKETSSPRAQICPHNAVSQVLMTLTYCSMTFSTACRSASGSGVPGFPFACPAAVRAGRSINVNKMFLITSIFMFVNKFFCLPTVANFARILLPRKKAPKNHEVTRMKPLLAQRGIRGEKILKLFLLRDKIGLITFVV